MSDASKTLSSQTVVPPACFYCHSTMTLVLNKPLGKDHYYLYECKDCRFEVAVPNGADAPDE